MAKDPQEEDDLKLCSHTMMLPTRGQLEGRMIVTAYEHGLDNVTEDAVTAVVYAVEVRLGCAALVFPLRQQQRSLCAVWGSVPHWRGRSCCFDGPAASGGVRLESEGFGPTDMVMYWICACEG